VKSNSEIEVGVAPTDGINVKIDAVVATLSVNAFAVVIQRELRCRRRWNNRLFTSVKKMLRSWRSALVDGVAVEPARAYVSGSVARCRRWASATQRR